MNKKKVSKKSTTLFSNNKTGVLRFHAANRSSRIGSLLWIVLLCLFAGSSAIAQTTLALGNFNESKQVDDPMMLTKGEGWRRSMYIYPKEVLMEALAKEYELARNYDAFKRKQKQTVSGQPAFYFNSLAMFRLSDEYSLPPNSSKFRIYVRNSEANKFENGTTWKEQTRDAILVFDGDPTAQVGYANGLTTFLFSKAVPWTGNNLQVMFEFYTSQGNETKEPLKWAAADGIEQIDFGIQSGLVANGLHHPPADNIFSTGVQTHPDLRIGFTTEPNAAFQPIGKGHVAESEKSPIRKGAVGRNRNVYIYPWTMLSGIKSGSYIQSLELYRLSELNSLAPGNQLKIYLKNSIDYSFDQNTPSDWNGLLTDAVLVYQGDPKEIVGNSSGYKLFPFINPFPYAGDNLQVMFEYVKNDDNGGTDDIEWASSNPESDRDLDENQGRVLVETGGMLPSGNSLLADFTFNIPTLRLGTANGMEKLAALTDATASNGAVVTNGKRTYVINRVIYRPNKAEAITDDKPYQASSGKLFKSNYLLLHQLATNGVVNEQYVQGKLTARMGSNVVENHKIDLDINSSASNQQNTAGMVSYGDPAKLVTLTYNGTPYLAVEIPIYTSIESSLTDFAFTGYLQNDRLQLLAGSDLNQVDTASIAAYREKFDPVSNVRSSVNKMVVTGDLVVDNSGGLAAKGKGNDGTLDYYESYNLNQNTDDPPFDIDKQIGTKYNFLLLHELVTFDQLTFTGTDLTKGGIERFVNGKITARRGSQVSWNRRFTVEVNTASAYNQNRGSTMTYNEDEFVNPYDNNSVYPTGKLSVVKDGLKWYMALSIPTNSELQDFYFTGIGKNAELRIVKETQVATNKNSDGVPVPLVFTFPDMVHFYGDNISFGYNPTEVADDPDLLLHPFVSTLSATTQVFNWEDPIAIRSSLKVDNDAHIANDLYLPSLKYRAAKKDANKLLALDENTGKIITANRSKTYSLEDKVHDATKWLKLGTINLQQSGQNALFSIHAGNYFSAPAKDGSVQINIRTYNNGGTSHKYYAVASKQGESDFIEEIRIDEKEVISGNHTYGYTIFLKAKPYTGYGFYTVNYLDDYLDNRWTPSTTLEDPTSTTDKVDFLTSLLNTTQIATLDDAYVAIGSFASKTNKPSIQYKLNVDGKIRADKLTVNTTGADFVFDSSYHLPPLHQVEQYVQKEHHLPGIASAKDMQTNGLDVGDNQTKLLQKVEELTLYVIQQQKEIETLKKLVKKKPVKK